MKNLLFVCLLLCLKAQAQHCPGCTYHWRQYSGPVQTEIATPDSAITSVTGLNQVGIYGFEFSVTNDFGTAKDSCTVTVIKGVLGIEKDSVFHFSPPKITKLEIKQIVRDQDIFLQIKSPRQQVIECTIYDVVGRAIAKTQMSVREGTNYISLPKPRVSGIYILRFVTYWEAFAQKVFI